MKKSAKIWQIAMSLLALTGYSRVGAQVEGSVEWVYSTLSTAAAGAIVSSPTLGPDGTIYFGLEIGAANSAATAGRMYALNPDGTEKWTFDTDDWVDASALVGSDGTVYFGSWDGTFYALNGETGQVKWTLETEAFIVSSAAQGPDGTLYFGAGDSLLRAVDPDTGMEKWTFPAADWIYASPVVGADGRIYFGSWDDSMYALEPDGSLVWTVTTGGDIVQAAALAADGTIVFGSRDRFVYALNPDGSLRWARQTGSGVEASPVIGADGSVSIGSTDGVFYRFTLDGDELWSTTIGAEIYSTAALRDDGSVVFGASDFSLHALSETGVELWSLETGDWIDGAPAIDDSGRIYVGGYDKRLYAVASDVALELGGEWPTFQRNSRRHGWQPRGVAAEGPGRLLNLSVRTQAGAGSQTLIAGFAIDGTGEREVLLRGIGPALADFGIQGAMSDPQITLVRNDETVGSNDNWEEAPNVAALTAATASVGAFALPAGSADAAGISTMGPGARSVLVTGSNGETGVALVEAYDAGGNPEARLVNLSARSQVGTGGDVLIAGFVLDDTASLLIRGIGPALTDFGVAGALADPVLQIYREGELLAQGDDAGTAGDRIDIEAWSAEVFAFQLPENSIDAALLVTLPEGVYSAVIKGSDEQTGVGLVEVYWLPEE